MCYCYSMLIICVYKYFSYVISSIIDFFVECKVMLNKNSIVLFSHLHRNLTLALKRTYVLRHIIEKYSNNFKKVFILNFWYKYLFWGSLIPKMSVCTCYCFLCEDLKQVQTLLEPFLFKFTQSLYFWQNCQSNFSLVAGYSLPSQILFSHSFYLP